MARYKGVPLGGIGDLGAFSFHETKNVIFYVLLADGIDRKRVLEEMKRAGVHALFHYVPLPLDAIYQIDAGNVRQYVSDRHGGWGVTALRAAGSAPRDFMACALDAELRREAGALPVLVMPTVERYTKA